MPTAFPYRHVLQTSGGVTNMNVDGSVTPVNFDFAPVTTGEIFYMSQLMFILGSGGVVNQLLTKFADLAALANGIDLSFTFGGVTLTRSSYVKTNMDLYRIFNIKTSVNEVGTTTMMTGDIKQDPPIIFLPNDRMRITIRDNLTSLTAMSMILYGKMYKG